MTMIPRRRETMMCGLMLAMCITVGLFTAEAKPAAKEAPQEPVLTLAAQCGVPFLDNAVLQQKILLPVWGTSLPGAQVTVSFDSQSKTTQLDHGKPRDFSRVVEKGPEETHPSV